MSRLAAHRVFPVTLGGPIGAPASLKTSGLSFAIYNRVQHSTQSENTNGEEEKGR